QPCVEDPHQHRGDRPQAAHLDARPTVPRGRGPAADRLQPTAAPELLSRFGHRLDACGGTRDHPPRVRTSRARRVPGPGTVGRSRGDGHLATVLGHRAVLARTDVVAEDLGRQVHRAAGVGHVHDPADATLDGCGAEDQVRLLPGVSPFLQVGDRVEARVAIGLGRVQVQVRVVPVVHGDTDEGEELRVLRGDPTGLEHRVAVHPVGFHTTLDHIDPQVDEPTHFDGTTEVDLTVPLAEVQVADGEHATGDVYRVEDPRPP